MFNYEEQKQDLKELYAILCENNFLDKFHLGFGTLLGAVRQEKLNTSFNDWDDFDFGVKQEDWPEFKLKIIPRLLKAEWEILYVYHTINSKINQITFSKKDNRMDVYQYFPVNKNEKEYFVHIIYAGNWELLKGLDASYYNDVETINLEGLDFYAPKDNIRYLIDMYGENWKTPCISEDEYKYWEDSPGIPWWSRKCHDPDHYNLSLEET